MGQDFVASLTGLVNGQRVRLSIEINATSSAYTSPGSALKPGLINFGGSTNLQIPGDTMPRYSVVGPHAEGPATIVLDEDRHGSTIDAWYDEPGYSQLTGQGVIHVSGIRRCA